LARRDQAVGFAAHRRKDHHHVEYLRSSKAALFKELKKEAKAAAKAK
jgi:hypothetical protein